MTDESMVLKESAEAVLELFRTRPSARLTFGEIAAALEGEHPRLSDAVDLLLAKGDLVPAGKRRYALPEEMGLLKGRIFMRPDGSGFVRVSDDRIEIPRRHAGYALDGDIVFVRKLRDTDHRGRTVGRVTSVLRRSRKGLSGVARMRRGRWVIDPLNPVLPRNIPLEVGREDISPGRLVFAELVYGKGKPTARLRRKLGGKGSPIDLIDAVVMDYALPAEFPGKVEKLAMERAAAPVDVSGREDFRDLFTITVDPVDARDFDDAISFAEDGGVRKLYVHIADVAAYVGPGDPIDAEARLRGTSVYLPDRVIPMLPFSLSNGACSLRPGEDRAARTVVIEFDGSGERLNFSIVPSLVRSDHRLTYEEALEYLRGGGADHGLRDVFDGLAKLSRDLDRQRKRRGALELDTREYGILFDDEGWPAEFRPVPSDESHRMVENFMVEANRAVADHCTWTGLPVLFRVHDEPSGEALEKLKRSLAELKIKVPGGAAVPKKLSRILESIESPALKDLVSELVLRAMQRAVYFPRNSGHFGLALRSYMHFTSPIRRYPDLLAHQMLSIQEKGGIPRPAVPIEELADNACFTERNAERAERDAVELMALAFLSRRIGSVHGGVVTGVKRFGIFVRLDDVPVEGLVQAGDIRRGGVFFRGGDGPFREGSLVEVRVASVDVLGRKLSLVPAGR